MVCRIRNVFKKCIEIKFWKKLTCIPIIFWFQFRYIYVLSSQMYVKDWCYQDLWRAAKNYVLSDGKSHSEHSSYTWIIIHEKCRRPDSNWLHLKWRFGTHGNWKNQNPADRFEAMYQLNSTANSAHLAQFLR